jgi:hypothetical protein
MNGFIRWLMSPLSEWSLQAIQHKLLVGAVGAGMAYWLYRKQLPTWQIVLYALAAAYGTSMILNAAQRFSALQPVAQVPLLPAGLQPVATGLPAAAPQTLAPVADEKKEEGLGDDQGIFG